MVILADLIKEVPNFTEILGLGEEPLGMVYSPVAPAEGFSPQQAILPSAEQERLGEINWEETMGNFSCIPFFLDFDGFFF